MTAASLLLRFESLAVLILSLLLFRHLGGHWIVFGILFLSPDLFMLGYLAGPRLGSIAYNAAHTYLSIFLVALLFVATHHVNWLSYLAIWSAHIGFDRLLGYGLKYPTAFTDTHLQRV